MIVVEGFDCSGKSTIANKLADALCWPVLHSGGPTADTLDVQRCLNRSYARLNERVIQDRITYVSESVYSCISYPEKAAIALSSIYEISRVTSKIAVTLIYCRPPTDFLTRALAQHADKRHDSHGHMARIRRDAYTLINFYDTVIEMIRRQRVSVITYDRSLPTDKTSSIIATLRSKYT